MRIDDSRVNGRIETWPPATRVVLGFRIKERCIATFAVVDTRRFGIPIDTREGLFSTRLTRDLKFLRGELFLPLDICFFNAFYLRFLISCLLYTSDAADD